MKLSKKKGLEPLRFIGIPIILLVWEIIARYARANLKFSTEVLPTIEYVIVQSFPGLATFGTGGLGGYDRPSFWGAVLVLLKQSIPTLARVLGGTALGLTLGVGIGLLTWWSKTFKRIIEPIILIIRNIPLLALMPLFLLWFGGREIGNIIFMLFAVSIMVVINTTTAIRNLNPVYARFAFTMGASRWHILKTVVIPAIVPELAGGVRVILAMAWAIVLGAEFLAAQSGIGRILLFSMNFMATGRMIVILILFAAYAFGIYKLFGILLKRITIWVPR